MSGLPATTIEFPTTRATRRGRLWVVAATILVGLAIWGVALFTIGRQVGRPFPGFFYSPERVVSGFTPRDFTGRQAGLRPGDWIVAVDGRPFRELPRLVAAAGVGRTLVYTVDRGGSRLDVAVPTMLFTPAIMARFLPGYLLSSLIFLSVAIFVYRRDPDGRPNRFLLVYLSVWTAGMGIVWECFMSQSKWLAYLLIPYAVTAPVAGWVFLWNIPADRTRREFLRRWPLIKAFTVAGVAAIVVLMTVRVLADVLGRDSLWRLLADLEGWPYYVVFGMGSAIFKVSPVLAIVIRNKSGPLRRQAMPLLVGLVLGLAGWFMAFWTPAALHTEPIGNVQLGGLIPAVYPLSIGYAILRYQLLNIRVVIRKGLIYSLLTAMLTAVFVLLALATGYVFQRLTGRTSLLAMLLPALLVAFLFQPAREAIQTFVDRAFFRRDYEARRTLAAFSQGLNTLHERQEVVQLLQRTVGETLGAREVGLWLVGADRGPLASRLEREQKPVRDTPADTSPAAQELRRAGLALAVPLLFGERLLGILALTERRSGEPYGEDDLDLLTTLAPSAALALENARLHEERLGLLRDRFTQAAAVQEEERRRIARELHDGVGPSLASLRMRLRTVHKLLEREHNPLAGEVDELVGQAQDNIRDVRRLIYDLRPAVLDEVGLVAAIREYVRRYQQDHRITVDLRVPDEPLDLPAAVETTLFRIAQEALTNVAKHARAERAEVTLTQGPKAISLVVLDHGAGFTAEASPSGNHLGLWSMRKRVEQFGGGLDIQSRPGHGTRLAATIPTGIDQPGQSGGYDG